MYVKKAAEKTFVRNIRAYNVDEIDTYIWFGNSNKIMSFDESKGLRMKTKLLIINDYIVDS